MRAPSSPKPRDCSLELLSRLAGLYCPGVKLPAGPKLLKFDSIEVFPPRSRLGAPAPVSNTSAALLLSKYDDLASLRCLGVPLSAGILVLLIKLGGGIGDGVIVLVLELALLNPALLLGAAPSKVLLEPISHALSSSEAISLTRMAGSPSFNLSIASCRP